MKNPYFPFYAYDWRADPKIAMLTYEERGVFLELLTIFWTLNQGCSLADDDIVIARILHIQHRKWKKIKKSLMGTKSAVLHSENGRIFNKRLLVEFIYFTKKCEQNKKIAVERERVKRAKLLKNNERDTRDVPTNVPRTCHERVTILDTDTDTDTEDIKKKYIKKEKTTMAKKRATQVTEDFQPNEKHYEIALESKVECEDQCKRFVDYYTATGKTMINWNAAFNNWLRKASEFKQPRGNNNAKQPSISDFRHILENKETDNEPV
jgi:uncharacterized protein YdaU (DUF1376 family)